MQRILTFSFICGLGFLLSCTRHSPTHSHSKNGLSLRWASANKPESLDWTLCEQNSCIEHVSLLMEGLTRLKRNNDRLHVLPTLARHWHFLSSHRIVFRLKRNVKWTDGTPLHAKQFSFAWKRLLESNSSQKHLLFSVRNAMAFSEGKKPFYQVGIHIKDAHTLVVHLNSPTPDFPQRVAHPSLWPSRYPTRKKEAAPITLGRYTAASYQASTEMEYQRNEFYVGSRPQIQTIYYRYEPSSQTRLSLYMNDEVDLVDRIPLQAKSLFPKTPEWHNQVSLEMIGLRVNPNSSLSRKPKTRRRLFDALPSQTPLPLVRAHGILLPSLFAELKTSPLSILPERYVRIPSLGGLRLYPGSSFSSREIAQWIQATWASELNLVTPLVKSPQEAALSLAKYRLSPYSNMSSRALLDRVGRPIAFQRAYTLQSRTKLLLNQEDRLLRKEALFKPLFFKTEQYVVRDRFNQIQWNPTGFWEFF